MAGKKGKKKSPVKTLIGVLLGLIIVMALAGTALIVIGSRGSSSEADSLLSREDYKNADDHTATVGESVDGGYAYAQAQDAAMEYSYSEIFTYTPASSSSSGSSGQNGNGIGKVVDSDSESDTQASSSTSNADYIIPDSDTRLITADEAKKLSDNDLRIAINEIYARHGRMFDDAGLQSYFNSKSWYKGTVAPAAFNEGVLNSTEKANVDTLGAERSSR